MVKNALNMYMLCTASISQEAVTSSLLSSPSPDADESSSRSPKARSEWNGMKVYAQALPKLVN